MRSALVAFVAGIGLAASALSATAAPTAPNLAAQHNAYIVAIAGGCGPGFRPTPTGRCAPFHHGLYGHRFFGGGWPTDHMAGQLNAEELGRLNSGR